MTNDLIMRMENPILTQARSSLGLSAEPNIDLHV
jgi:hypothetical protein